MWIEKSGNYKMNNPTNDQPTNNQLTNDQTTNHQPIDILSYIDSFITNSEKKEEEKPLEITKQPSKKEKLRKEKKNPVTKKTEKVIYPEYRPPEWQNVFEEEKGKELSFEEMSNIYLKQLRFKKIESLSEIEVNILKNIRILKDCYCTNDPELVLANYFIGKFDFDPFWNPYAKTATSKYANENVTCLDGHSFEKDGFNIANWPLDRKSIFVNPPFSKLPKAAEICNIACKRDARPAIALVGNLDFNNYVKEAFRYADYCIWLGRVHFEPMVGITVSTPRWNSLMLIYNSPIDLKNGSMSFILDDKEYYVIDLRNKKTFNLKQLELFT